VWYLGDIMYLWHAELMYFPVEPTCFVLISFVKYSIKVTIKLIFEGETIKVLSGDSLDPGDRVVRRKLLRKLK